RVKVACPKAVPGPCKGVVKLVRPATKSTKKLGLGHHGFTIARGKASTVPVTLSDKGLAALVKAGSLRVRARATAKDGIGTKRTSSRKLKLTI
ncbi:MAG: hypothetical protein QOG86_1374, partial [Thermoleophilaceae bacterium]|nr:hypothetical protein [Thermoleophilaceae bacterium]